MADPSLKNYDEKAVIDFAKQNKVKYSAILLGLVLIVSVTFAMAGYADVIRPGALDSGIVVDQDGKIITSISLWSLAGLVAVVFSVIVVHELVHGVAFWIVSGVRPIVGSRGVFIFISAPPTVFFERNKYLWVGIAPIISLSLMGILLVPFLSPSLILFTVLFVALNAAGSAGDLMILLELLSYPSDSIIRDFNSSIVIYGKKTSK